MGKSWPMFRESDCNPKVAGSSLGPAGILWILLLWQPNGGGCIFHSPSSLIFPACSPVLSDLLRDSLCTALQTEKLWI